MPELMLTNIRSFTGSARHWLQSLIAPYRQMLLILLLSSVGGALLAAFATQVTPTERIVVGNTSGTLTSLLDLNDARILVGAGPSRTHAANLVGRETRPWDREVDILVLPGWDDRHVAGALGLLERDVVRGISVIGLPGDEPSWTLLEREAEQRDVPLTYLNRSSLIQLGENTRLAVSPVANTPDGAWIRLTHLSKQVDIIDAANSVSATPDPKTLSTATGHIVINVRGHEAPENGDPMLLVMPAPHWQHDFTDIDVVYWSEVQRNEQLTLKLKEAEIRLPLDQVRPTP